MQVLKIIRRVEKVFVFGVVTTYVMRQLLLETLSYNSHAGEWENTNGYNFYLNTVFPLVAGALFILVAWYLFHYLAYPTIPLREFEPKVLLYLTLTILCAAAGVFFYYYFKRHLLFQYTAGSLIGVRIDSLYRKLSVFSDTIAVGIILGVYESCAQFYYYLHQKLTGEQETSFTYISYFLLACFACLCFILAFLVDISVPLWDGKTAYWLLLGGLLLLLYILQEYGFYWLLPFIQTPAKLIRNTLVYFLIAGIGVAVVWGCYIHFRGFSFRGFAIVLILSFISGIAAYLRSILFREKNTLQTQVSTKSAELSSLRSQINPHFLFNALNSLYATALKENSDKTADGIQKLGDMMRFMLQENNLERIPLAKEIEYLHNYIDLQRLRVDESQGVEIRVNIPEPDKEIYLAPMLLNPLVENAFKHGISLEQPSWIYITLTLDVTRLYFKVHNSLHAQRENDPEQYSSGVGLANVRKRLGLIYPNQHTLDIQQSEKDHFVALTIMYQ